MWDKRYAVQGFVYGSSQNDFVKEQFRLITENGHILCLAERRNAIWLLIECANRKLPVNTACIDKCAQ